MKAATTAQHKRFAELIELGCIICVSPAVIHHIGTHMGGGRDHDKVIPLCPRHHTTGGYGTALHAGKTEFEKTYGTEKSLFFKAQKLLKIKQAGEMSVVGCR